MKIKKMDFNNANNIRMNDKFVIFALIGGLIILLAILFANNKNNHVRIDEIKSDVGIVDPFSEIKLTAKSAIVWDMKNQKMLFSLEEGRVLPLASLTKAMMALTATELVPDYTTITIGKDSLGEEGDIGLLAEEKWSLKNLLALSLISSSNDGARAIAAVTGSIIDDTEPGNAHDEKSQRMRFVRKMNDLAKSIGLTKTYFGNENGLDKDETESGAYGTARDVTSLFDYIMRNHPSLLEPTKYSELTLKSLNNIDHEVRNTNIALDTIPGLLGSKTGFTDLAGGNLVVVMDPGLEGPYIISVLGSTLDGRFYDVGLLAKATKEYVTKIK